MHMDELAARRVLLVHAIEAGDHQGKLLSRVEREQIDTQSRDAAALDSNAVTPERFFDQRAQRVLHTVEGRSPGLAALQERAAWQGWVAAGLPVGAIALGVITDVVANPHRVDLLSLPLLGIVAWNIVMYLGLARRLALAARPRACSCKAVTRHHGWAAALAPRRRTVARRDHRAVLPALAARHAGAHGAVLEAGAAPVCRRLGRRDFAVAAHARAGGGVPRRLGKHLPRCYAGARHPEPAAVAGAAAVSVPAVLGAGSGGPAVQPRRRRPRRGALGVHVRGAAGGAGGGAAAGAGRMGVLARARAGAPGADRRRATRISSGCFRC